MRIAFLGCGAMGGVLLESALQVKGVVPNGVFVAEKDAARRAALARRYRGVRISDDPQQVVAQADVVMGAVKPQQMAEVLRQVRPVLTPRHTLVSIAAGVSLRCMRRLTGGTVPLVRAMPNLPLRVGAGVTALCATSGVCAKAMRFVRALFSVHGEVVDVPERLMDAVTAVSGSGPAYVFFLAELLRDAAQRLGIPRSVARRLAIRTVVGAARMLETTDEDPSRLRELVSSRGGTTERALEEMRRAGVPASFVRAVRAARDRARELAAAVEKAASRRCASIS